MKISAIIPAGGKSSRFGCDKLIQKINEKEIILMTAEKFQNMNEIDEIIILAPEHLMGKFSKILKPLDKVKIVLGGKTRQQSVKNGLLAANDPDFVVIHDAARPFIKTEIIKKTIEKAFETNAAIACVKTTDTIKMADENFYVTKTFNRDFLYNVQTPQVFEYKFLLEAHKMLENQNFTDDAAMVEYLHQNVAIVEGDYSNIKITTPIDFNMAQMLADGIF